MSKIVKLPSDAPTMARLRDAVAEAMGVKIDEDGKAIADIVCPEEVAHAVLEALRPAPKVLYRKGYFYGFQIEKMPDGDRVMISENDMAGMWQIFIDTLLGPFVEE